jgi:hypothetical protein
MKQRRGKKNILDGRFQREKAPLPVTPEKLTRSEKRRLLAQIVRFNPADCFDESGAFDINRVRRLPGAALQQLAVHEITRTDTQGNTTVRRRITLRTVDKIRAMRFDEELLEGEEEDQPEVISEDEKRHLEIFEKKNQMFIQWKASGNYPDGPPPPGYNELWELDDPWMDRPRPDG